MSRKWHGCVWIRGPKINTCSFLSSGYCAGRPNPSSPWPPFRLLVPQCDAASRLLSGITCTTIFLFIFILFFFTLPHCSSLPPGPLSFSDSLTVVAAVVTLRGGLGALLRVKKNVIVVFLLQFITIDNGVHHCYYSETFIHRLICFVHVDIISKGGISRAKQKKNCSLKYRTRFLKLIKSHCRF